MTAIDQTTPSRRDLLLFVITLAAIGLLAAALAVHATLEAGGTNSFALVAESFLKGVPYVERCFDGDCARRGGHLYVVFPPLPGVVAMPLVAAFGPETRGFAAIGLLALALSLFLWNRILARAGVGRDGRIWLMIAIAGASPLFYVTFHSDKIWFFAQALAFPLVALALHEAQARRCITAGLAIGLAFLCRQMSIFYAPIVLAMLFREGEPFFAVTRERLNWTFRIALPVLAALSAYFAYDIWRFGNPLDTGYSSIAFEPGMLLERVSQYGLWNKAYLVFNAFYLFLQGFHAEFAEPDLVRLSGMDSAGTSILAASPWLLFLVFTPRRWLYALGLALIVGLSAVTMFYHSNGFSQYNTQRYILDWLPVALLMLAAVFRDGRLQPETRLVFKLLVLWGVLLNVATIGVLTLTHAA
jgi:hypothetical protein